MAKPLMKRSQDFLSLPDPYNTWGEYCRMKNPFHPKCRGIAVQKLIDKDFIIEQDNRERLCEYLVKYLRGKYPNITKKLLNNRINERSSTTTPTPSTTTSTSVSSLSSDDDDSNDSDLKFIENPIPALAYILGHGHGSYTYNK